MSLKISLIICTYMRSGPLRRLLNSVKNQSFYPNEILIIDGSTNNETEKMLDVIEMNSITYHMVNESNRGLTRQRNYGISKINEDIDIVCFLDDDTELYPDYFENLINTFRLNPEVVGVGGVSVNENRWVRIKGSKKFNKYRYYELDGYVIKEGLRNVLRNYLGLQSPLLPGKMPDFSHGRTNSYPLNDKIYEVDLLIGMSFSFKKSVFDKIKFSNYFHGYGLYEDADFSIKALRYGKNVIDTSVKLNHYHDHAGRPNKFNYGKMVLRNGWYVWRLKFPAPSLKARLKWNVTALLLTLVRFSNVINTNNRMEALTEGFGRTIGWFSLIFNKPKIER